jgi:basic amino acid/polyamine antiporter, APA family
MPMVPAPRPPAVAPTGLRRALGLWQAVALGIGGTVGGGVFVLVGAAVGVAGPAALVAYLLAFGASLAIALPYAELACRLPVAGGGYAFARMVLGPRWGFLMGWGYWGAYLFLSGYVTLGFGGYLSAGTGLPASVGAVGLIGACTALNLLGVKMAGRAQAAVVLVALSGLAGLAGWGLPGLDLDRLQPFAPHGAAGVLAAALLAFLSFGGFDMVAAAGEEVQWPERNLPRAILLTLVAVLGLYLAVTLVAMGTLSAPALAASQAPLADSAQAFGGPVGRHLIVAAALLTTAATANAVLVVTSRVVFAMARDNFLPSRLGTVSPRTGAPTAAVAGNGLLMAAMAALGSIGASAAAGGFLYVLHFLPPLAALVMLRRQPTDARPAFTTPAPRMVLPLAFAASAVLLVASGRTGFALGGAWLLAGLTIPAIRRLRARHATRQP